MSTEQELAELTASTTDLTLEVAGKSAELTAKVDAASASASAASASESSADQHRVDALASKDASAASELAAEQSKNEAEGYKNQSLSYRDDSLSYRDDSLSYRDEALSYRDQSEVFKDQAQTAAQSFAPTLQDTYDNGNVISVNNADGSVILQNAGNSDSLEILSLQDISGNQQIAITGKGDILSSAASKEIFKGLGSNNLSIADSNSTLVVNGNLVVSGTTTTLNTQNVNVSDNVITINDGDVGPGVTSGNAGIEVYRGPTTPNYKFTYEESTQSFKIGEEGNLQPVATREDTPIGGALARWDASTHKYVTDGNLSYNGTILTVARADSNSPRLRLANNTATFDMLTSGGSWSLFDGANARITVDVNGDVGVGITDADSKLHVQSGDAGNVSSPINSTLTLENSGANYLSILSPDTSLKGVVFGSPSNNQQAGIYYTGTSSDELQFRISGNQTKMSLSSSGNLEVLTAGRGLILKSSNGTRYKISVNNSGDLITEAL